MTDADIIAGVIQREGGFVNDPADSGGPTKYGITQGALADWRGHAVTIGDVQALTTDEAAQIYADRYIKRPGFDRIQDDALRAEVIDAGVNHWITKPTMWLQAIAGVKQDGVFGPVSATAINAMTPRTVVAKFTAARARFYGRLITNDPTQAKFDAGWMDRLAGFIEQLA